MAFPSTSTFNDLINEVIHNLQGWGANTDQIVSLATGIDDNDTSLTVDTEGEVTRGIIEVDDELMYVSSTSAASLTVPSWGRGYRGTLAAAHSAGAAVIIAPTWPRSTVAREINNAIEAVYPMLWGVEATEFDASSVTWQYELPAAARRVLAVEWQYNSIDGWTKHLAWEMSNSADTTDFPSGKMISIGGNLPTGATIRVIYSKVPTPLTSASDAFSTTGLPGTARDVIVLGASASLTPWLDIPRIPVQAAEADVLDQPSPLGAAFSISDKLTARYNMRLEQERAALLTQYPVPQHRIRG